MNATMTSIGRDLALAGFRMGAIQICPEKPFLWASGTYNPIYNDNRMFLMDPATRRLVNDGLYHMYIRNFSRATIIAGTATAGISPGTTLADRLEMPFCYVRERQKDHGKKNQIEGLDEKQDFGKALVLVIEELFSTGGSSAKAVQAIRNRNGTVKECYSIFSYELPTCAAVFAGETDFDENGSRLQSPCATSSIFTYSELITMGIAYNFINKKHENLLMDWMKDQPNWGANNGFPPVVKK